MSWAHKGVVWCFHLIFIVIPLIFLPWTSELFEFNKIIALYIITAFIAFFWICRCILEKKFIFCRTSLDIPILIFLISQSLSLIFSLDIRTSLLGYYGRFNGGLVPLTCYSLLYWAYVTFMDQKSTLKTIAYYLLPTALLVSLYGVLQHFGIDDHLWIQDVRTRVFSTLGQPNWLAAYLAALIFIPISNLIKEYPLRSILSSVQGYSFFALLFSTLLFTKSRSGLLAFGMSWLIFWVLALKKHTGRFKPFLILNSAFLILGLLIPNPLRDLVLKPTTINLQPTTGPALESGGTESGAIRKIVWTGAIRIWQANTKNFWLGTGPETFAMSYFQYRPIEHNTTSEWEFLYNKAHNEFLNYLSTTGLIGLGSYLILLVLIFISFKPTNHNLQLTTALLAGWFSLSITNFWGFSVVPTQLLLFLLPAISHSLNTNLQPTTYNLQPPSKVQKSLMAISILAISYLLFAISRYWLADYHYASAQKSMRIFSSTNDPADIVSAYDSASAAYSLSPHEPVIDLELADIAAYMAILTSDTATTSAQFSQLALSAATHALTISPSHPTHYKTRSRILILLSALDDNHLLSADADLALAQTLSPTDPRIPYNRAIIAKYANRLDQAKLYLDKALQLKADFPEALLQLENLATSSGIQ